MTNNEPTGAKTLSPPPEVVDVHCRIGPGRPGEDRPAETVLQEMDASGVRQAWICPMDPFAAVRNAQGNSMIAQRVQAHAGRFIGCAVANPWYGNDALAELVR